MDLDGLETTYGQDDFDKKKDFEEYCKCVAKHIVGAVCETCPKNFYLDKLRTDENIKKKQSGSDGSGETT